VNIPKFEKTAVYFFQDPQGKSMSFTHVSVFVEQIADLKQAIASTEKYSAITTSLIHPNLVE
jgi:hypothetical protein